MEDTEEPDQLVQSQKPEPDADTVYRCPAWARTSRNWGWEKVVKKEGVGVGTRIPRCLEQEWARAGRRSWEGWVAREDPANKVDGSNKSVQCSQFVLLQGSFTSLIWQLPTSRLLVRASLCDVKISYWKEKLPLSLTFVESFYFERKQCYS